VCIIVIVAIVIIVMYLRVICARNDVHALHDIDSSAHADARLYIVRVSNLYARTCIRVYVYIYNTRCDRVPYKLDRDTTISLSPRRRMYYINMACNSPILYFDKHRVAVYSAVAIFVKNHIYTQ